MTADIIGYLGGIFSSISFLPQVIRIWKTKSAQDLSMATLLLLATNVTLWLIYGITIASTPLWLTNAIVLIMVLTMIVFKIKFRKNNYEESP
jgi:MtN3 and saliva related transmembrane protein